MPFLPPNQQRQNTEGKVGQSEVTVKVSPEEEKNRKAAVGRICRKGRF